MNKLRSDSNAHLNQFKTITKKYSQEKKKLHSPKEYIEKSTKYLRFLS